MRKAVAAPLHLVRYAMHRGGAVECAGAGPALGGPVRCVYRPARVLAISQLEGSDFLTGCGRLGLECLA